MEIGGEEEDWTHAHEKIKARRRRESRGTVKGTDRGGKGREGKIIVSDGRGIKK
jgi:hypothetical protein